MARVEEHAHRAAAVVRHHEVGRATAVQVANSHGVRPGARCIGPVADNAAEGILRRSTVGRLVPGVADGVSPPWDLKEGGMMSVLLDIHRDTFCGRRN